MYVNFLNSLKNISKEEFDSIIKLNSLHSFDDFKNGIYNTAVYTDYVNVYKIINISYNITEIDKFKNLQMLIWNIELLNEYMNISILGIYKKSYLIYTQKYVKPVFLNSSIFFYKTLLTFCNKLTAKFNNNFSIKQYLDLENNSKCKQFAIDSDKIKIHDLTYKNVSLLNDNIFIYDCNLYITFDYEILQK